METRSIKAQTIAEIQKDPDAIKKINRIFHDWDADSYENEHPEIYKLERDAWEKLFRTDLRKLKADPDLTILDIGTGNGFVIEVIAPFLSPSQKVIFNDISEKMIEVVKKKFEKYPFKKEFIIGESNTMPLPDNSVGLITVNSVLHHLPEHELFLKEARRLLTTGGALVIKHEPNIRYPRNSILRNLFLFLKRLRTDRTQSPSPADQGLLDALEREGIVFSDTVSKNDIQSLVDISSPTAAGGLDMDRGFDPYSIIEKFFPDAEHYNITTYAYLGKFNEQKNFLTRMLSHLLKALFPKDGALFDLVVEKK